MHVLEQQHETQPPQGGIFLSSQEYEYAAGLLKELPDIRARSTKARSKLDETIPLPSHQKNGKTDLHLQQDQAIKLLYVRQQSHDAIAHRNAVIDAQD